MSLTAYTIQKYLKRIGYSQSLNPTLDVLQQIQKLHLLHIPFENLDIHYNTPIELDVDKIYQKIVMNNRGGFCYELNGLFYQLLSYIGFNAKQASARVFDQESGYSNEFDHLTIVVTIEGADYLTDVGFGEFAFSPLKMKSGLELKDERGRFKIDTYESEYFRVSKLVDGEWVPEYIFKNTHHDLNEFKEMCIYHQTSPNSHFTQKKLISSPTERGRITLMSNQLKILENDGIQEIEIKNSEEFESKLLEYFHIQILS